ncbi:hypothetical protein DFH06DRAFT_921386, partial [Mycena polygramma]
HGTSKKDSTHADWTAVALVILVRVLGGEKKLGRQAELGWCSESYTRVVVELNKAGLKYTSKQVKSCWTQVRHLSSSFPFLTARFQLKGQYKIYKEISGFSWDLIKSLVTATDAVWDTYLDISKHKKHRPFRNRLFVHYDDMAILCDNVMATGE